MTAAILVVDDDPVQRRLVQAALERSGHQTASAENGAQALRMLEAEAGRFGAVILDLVMPGGPDGLAVLRRMRELGLTLPVIVQTAQGGIDTAVGAMREGAFDFVVKPASPPKLGAAVENALKVAALGGEAQARAERRRGGGSPSLKELSTRSPAMERALRLARKAAAADIPVLIEGESGVGKEVLARAIRAGGPRKGKPFVTVNCGAIPENLVESILFGHEKGAFTGASERHAGKFVEADGGTLFLDEVGDLPLPAQVKLLRAVQEGEVDPVGGRQTVKVDIRLISATHRNLIERVREGLFREDLFYRLNVFPIMLPPLRARPEDVPMLVERFIAKAGAASPIGRVTGISRSALALLQGFDWPGNIRQLENAVLRAAVLAEGDTLTEDEFPQIRAQMSLPARSEAKAPAFSPASDPAPAAEPAPRGLAPSFSEPLRSPGLLPALDGHGEVRPLAELELDMIRFALAHYGGQMSEVARRLRIGRSTLYRKLREHGIEGGEEPEEEASERLAS
ncbi:MAG TPA: sigma-54 dependent transcriptional regulator [Mesorhizobium sp.]|jgi:DNA-binding NtrC family response regulator|nr:sigma-54 dependent transcriptional regulator [Mesorhizobium sp.]